MLEYTGFEVLAVSLLLRQPNLSKNHVKIVFCALKAGKQKGGERKKVYLKCRDFVRVHLGTNRMYRGVDTPTMQSYNPFCGLHLICAKKNVLH